MTKIFFPSEKNICHGKNKFAIASFNFRWQKNISDGKNIFPIEEQDLTEHFPSMREWSALELRTINNLQSNKKRRFQ
jgi:hypothetical protein